MPDAVLYLRTAHADHDQRVLLEAAERLGYRRVESVTYDLDAAIGVVEAGHAKTLLVVDPRALGDRRRETEQRVTAAGGILEYAARPSPRRAAGPDWQTRRRRARGRLEQIRRLSEEAIWELREPEV